MLYVKEVYSIILNDTFMSRLFKGEKYSHTPLIASKKLKWRLVENFQQ